MSPSSFGKAASSSRGIPGSGQPHKALAEGVRLCQWCCRWINSSAAGSWQNLERNRNWLRARGKSQQISASGKFRSSLALSLRPSVNKSRTAGADQPLNTKVRTLGVPSLATVASCSQRLLEDLPSLCRAARKRGRHGGRLSIKPPLRLRKTARWFSGLSCWLLLARKRGPILKCQRRGQKFLA